jgi:DNA-binding NarL/FixJ family response regulator
MIRTLIVDHHPALRAGVKVVLEDERDMVVVGSQVPGCGVRARSSCRR